MRRLVLNTLVFLPLLIFTLGVMSPLETAIAQPGIVPDCPVTNPECENTEAYDPQNYGNCEFVALTNNILQFIVGLTALFAAIAFIYAGFQMVISQGNPSKITAAKSLFVSVLIGFLIIFSAFLVVQTIMKVLVGDNSSLLQWQTIDQNCSYARAVGTPDYSIPQLGPNEINLFEFEETVSGTMIVTNYRNTAYGGSCELLTAGKCAVSNLKAEGLFAGKEEHASRICNKESGGVSQWSTTDLCKDGSSFSGGWFQINVIAHADKIPGCQGAFTVYSSGTQGKCVDERTNSKGVTYCAARDCAVTDTDKYKACRKGVEDWGLNSRIANQLYQDSGQDFTDWKISGGLCNAPI